jgi:hypothetical protein
MNLSGCCTMSEFTWSLIIVGVYRLVALCSGILSIYLGYKLFRVGIYEKAGELKASFGGNHLLLRQAAPGTFFALFGAIVISIGLWKGIRIQSSEDGVEHAGAPIAMSGVGAIPTTSNRAQASDKGKAPSTEDPHPNSSQVDPILNKVISRTPLTDDELNTLTGWRRSFGIQVMGRFSPHEKHMTG